MPAVAWVLGGKIVCQKYECEFPLDGKTFGLGAFQLMVLVFNGYGSSYTKHVVQVLKSNWSPTKPFNPEFKRPEPSVLAKPILDMALQGSTRVAVPKGNAVQAYPEHLSVLGTVPKSFQFRGKFKTRDVAVARIQDQPTGDWFVLGYSDLSFPNEIKDSIRRVNVVKGGLRLHLLRDSVAKSSEAKAPKKFSENVVLETAELSLVPIEGGDVYLTRLRPSKKLQAKAAELRKANKLEDPLLVEAQVSSRVIVISGQAKVTLAKPPKGSPASVVLPAGVEFIVYEDGTVAPLARPNPKRMEKLMGMTVTPEEIAEKMKSQQAATNANIGDLVKQADKLLETEDYFEILGLLNPVESRAKENPRILYLLGIANKGVYQISEAKKKFEGALALDPGLVDAHWQIMQMELEVKNWELAKSHLESSEDLFSSEDPRTSEIPYYKGVIAFNLEEGFTAKNSFTRALWEEKLDGALKQSSGSFLQNLTKAKNWSAVFPFGVQILPAQEVPADGLTDPTKPEKKLLMRGLVGAILSYDKATNASESGWYFGTGFSAISMTNVPRSFKSSDLITGELSFSQTKLSFPEKASTPESKEGEEQEKSSLKLTQSVNQLILNSKQTSQTFKFGVNLDKWTNSVAFEQDLIEKGDQSANAVKLATGYGLSLFASEAGVTVDTDLGLSGKYTLRSENDPPHSLKLDVGPSLGVPLSARNSLKFGLAGGLEQRIQKVKQQAISGGASLGFNSFLTPWLLFVPSASYDVQIETKGARKPGNLTVSLLMTALF